MNLSLPRCASVVLLALALSGCAAQLTASERTLLESGEDAYRQKNYPTAISTLSQFLRDVKGKPEVTRALYLRGSSYALAGKRGDALTDLQRCIDTPGDPEAVWRAYVVLGTLHFEDGRWEPALRALNAAEKRIPDAPPKDAVLFRQGVCRERLGRWAEAREAFAELKRAFPGSDYAAQADRRLTLGASHYSVQCGVFGEQKNAESLAARLTRQGMAAGVRREQRNRRPAYIVLVGQFASYEEAKRGLSDVKRAVPDAVIWP
jgi:tetratricopeptide (TPR) repeat protein